TPRPSGQGSFVAALACERSTGWRSDLNREALGAISVLSLRLDRRSRPTKILEAKCDMESTGLSAYCAILPVWRMAVPPTVVRHREEHLVCHSLCGMARYM